MSGIHLFLAILMATLFCQGAELTNDTEKGQRIDVVLSGRDIPSEDFWSQADPYIKVYYKFDAGSAYIFYGQTNPSQDNPNPDWPQAFSFDFSGGDRNTQSVKFECWDGDVIWDDHIGDVEISLADLVAEASSSNDGRVHRVLQTINKGNIIIKTRLGTPTGNANEDFAPRPISMNTPIAKPDSYLKIPIAQFLSPNVVKSSNKE